MNSFVPESIFERAKDFSSEVIPNTMKSAKDAFLTDHRGNQLIDFSMGKATVTLGHGNEELAKEITKLSKTGQQLTFAPECYSRLAEILVTTIDSDKLEQAVFMKNGSDVIRLAMRICRSFTGNEVILFSGYHSWHDEYLEESWPRSGSSEAARSTVKNFHYCEDQLNDYLKQYENKVAAIIVTPEPSIVPCSFFSYATKKMLREKHIICDGRNKVWLSSKYRRVF